MFYTKSKHKILTLSLNLSDSFETDFLLNGGIGRLGDVKANREILMTSCRQTAPSSCGQSLRLLLVFPQTLYWLL